MLLTVYGYGLFCADVPLRNYSLTHVPVCMVSVHLSMLFLRSLRCEVHQTFTSNDFWDKDWLVKFWGIERL